MEGHIFYSDLLSDLLSIDWINCYPFQSRNWQKSLFIVIYVHIIIPLVLVHKYVLLLEPFNYLLVTFTCCSLSAVTLDHLDCQLSCRITVVITLQMVSLIQAI